MSETYGALQAASNDAGNWTLIEQGDTGEWAPLARGGKQNIVKLAQLLNTAEALLERQAEPADAAAPDPGPGPITAAEVEGWTQETYLQRRARLFVIRHPGPGGAADDYRDGSEHGRPYTTPAARLMTGHPDDHQPRLQLLKLRAAARDVAKTWTEQPATKLAKDWPAMNRLQQVLHELGADE